MNSTHSGILVGVLAFVLRTSWVTLRTIIREVQHWARVDQIDLYGDYHDDHWGDDRDENERSIEIICNIVIFRCVGEWRKKSGEWAAL